MTDGRIPPYVENAVGYLRKGDVPGFVSKTLSALGRLARDVSAAELKCLGGPPTPLAPPPPLPPHTLPPTTPALRPAGPGGMDVGTATPGRLLGRDGGGALSVHVVFPRVVADASLSGFGLKDWFEGNSGGRSGMKPIKYASFRPGVQLMVFGAIRPVGGGEGRG